MFLVYKGEMFKKNGAYSFIQQSDLDNYIQIKKCFLELELKFVEEACCEKHANEILKTLIDQNQHILDEQKKYLKELNY